MPSSVDLDDDPFIITSELEIRSILRSLQRHATLLRMYTRGNTDQSIMTTILALDDDAQRLIVDASPDDDLNTRLERSSALLFDTRLDSVNIAFPGEDLQPCLHEDLPAFSLPYPTKLRRIQRREFYRVDIPVGEPASCTLVLIDPGKPARRVSVRMKDISAGGVALLDMDSQLPHENGILLPEAVLTLPEAGEATVDLEVRRLLTATLPNKKEIVELGCAFISIDNPTRLLIQNYIGRLERRLNAKRHGF